MRGKVLQQRILHMSLSSKLKLLMIFLLVPLTVLIGLVLMALVRYSGQYDSIIQNLTVASKFSIDFKSALDANVYLFIISGKDFEQSNPFADIEQARGVVALLERTTTGEESRKQLRMISKFLDNEEKAIGEIRDNNEGYDWNIAKWDGSVITNSVLLTEAVYKYIYFETQMLADLRQQTMQEVQGAVVSISGIAVTLFLLLCIFALRTANSITRPIKALCQNIGKVGEGDFTVRPVESHNDEIQTLSESFDGMVERIGVLMENIREEQQHLRLTELKLLQAQINPHFLYNTFDTIIWLAEDHQDEQVVEMVTSLSTFFRTTLSKGQDFITVREEALHVRSYLEIQQFRYRDIMEYEIDIPPELGEHTIIKLTLQPLVENALYHGVKNKRGMGKITVTGRKDGDRLIFQVHDNGIGMREDELERLRESIVCGGRVGFGLANVQERIQLYFGAEYGLSVVSVYGEGTTVTVAIPSKEIQLNA